MLTSNDLDINMLDGRARGRTRGCLLSPERGDKGHKGVFRVRRAVGKCSVTWKCLDKYSSNIHACLALTRCPSRRSYGAYRIYYGHCSERVSHRKIARVPTTKQLSGWIVSPLLTQLRILDSPEPSGHIHPLDNAESIGRYTANLDHTSCYRLR